MSKSETSPLSNIVFIPHKQRLAAHRKDYLEAFNLALEYPWQVEDGRDPSPLQQKLMDKCAKLSGVPYWLMTTSCSQALQVAVRTLTKPGQLVMLPAYGWRAVANAVTYMERRITFTDIDETGNIDIEKLRQYLKSGYDPPAALIVIHGCGTLVDMESLFILCREYEIKLIEDAAPAFYMGESYILDKPGMHSDIVCYSFDFTKSPGTLGSGGGIATNNPNLYDRMYTTVNHGRDSHKEVVAIGTKCYMDNTSISILLKEIELTEKYCFRTKRNALAEWYNKHLQFPSIPGENKIWLRYTMSIPKEKQQLCLDKLRENKILARVFYKSEVLSQLKHYNPKPMPVADNFVNNMINLPCHHYMKQDEMHRIKEVVNCL